MTVKRQCGSCTLCCKLLPVEQLNKPANKWCAYASKAVGCAIYATRPHPCQAWRCLWIDAPAETWNLLRPDRAHYVIDIGADVVSINDTPIGVMQVWADPGYLNAWRTDIGLRALMERAAENGVATLVRNGATNATIVMPPLLTGSGEWFMRTDAYTRMEPTSMDERAQVFGTQSLVEWDASTDQFMPVSGSGKGSTT